MVFNSDGKEMMRLPISASVERYVQLLDGALKKNVKSIAEILKMVSEKPIKKISREHWSMLAGHAWYQDRVLGLSKKKLVATLKNLYLKVPVAYKNERYRFFLLYLSGSRGKLDQVREYSSFLDEMLQDNDFIDKNFVDVILMLPSVIQKIYKGRDAKERGMIEKRLLVLTKRKGKKS